MSIKIGNNILAKSSTYHPDLFDVKWSDHIINNISWLRADTFSWHSGELYNKAYEHLLADKQEAYESGNRGIQETIAGITISYELSKDGHKIVDADYPFEVAKVQTIYEKTGISWFYILDETNKRFKLPRTKFAFEGVRTAVGNYIEPGLPNITGSILDTGSGGEISYESGALYKATIPSSHRVTHVNDSNSTVGIGIDASRSSAIYGSSDTVQPQATEMYLYFYVGNYAQSDLENVAGEMSEVLNNKADIDLSNILSNIDFVVESQFPTAENNYTWYRKYKSGWVEQGGYCYASGSAAVSISYPIELARAEIPMTNPQYSYDSQIFLKGMQVQTVSTTGFTCRGKAVTSSNVVWENSNFGWQVSGMAAQ